jgi:3-hydroxy-3-methylglutaryl CoA synthase
MVGIISYGLHIPWLRIDRKTINAAMGWFGAGGLSGEKAVANHDEDSITVAVDAAINCLNGFDRETIDGLYFATTSSPYKERQGVGIITSALNIRPQVRAMDITDTPKAGLLTLLEACDAVKSGDVRNALACAGDCRMTKASSNQEQVYGDGGAALLVGTTNVLASLKGHYNLTYDFMDYWRASDEDFTHSWEDRWIREEGYTKFIVEAVTGLVNKYNLDINDFAKVIFPGPYPREHASIGKKLGIDPAKLQDPMLNITGDTGSAHPLVMLIAALEESKPGDKLIVASYGGGSDALFFEVTPEIEKVKGTRRVREEFTYKKELTSYEKYAFFRNILNTEKGVRAEYTEGTHTPISRLWRERDAILGAVGSRCKKCGTPQFPPQKVCVNPACGAINEMEPYHFSDKKGRLISYTADYLVFSYSPPETYGVIDFDGGGRYWFSITDCEADSLKVGLEVEMTFRKKYVDAPHGIHTYCWKVVPVRV